MFSPKLFVRRFTGLYTSPCTKLTFLLPYNYNQCLRKHSARRTKSLGISYGLKADKVCEGLPRSCGKLQSRRKLFVPRSFGTEYTTAVARPKVRSTFTKRVAKEEHQAITAMDGLREFISHPLTWDRNNGYMNILLGLAIFGYSFCTTCSGDATDASNEGRR